jgi:hypothetical protein
MSLLLNNLAQWRLEARLLALHLRDPEANAAVLKIADEYDHLAVLAARRAQAGQHSLEARTRDA